MPPRKRKQPLEASPLEPASKRANTASAQSIFNNASRFVSLPDELHLEIASHMPTVFICSEPEDLPLDRFGTDRYFTLNALSQTCRALRPVYLPFLSEKIEVYEGFRLVGKGNRLPKIPIAKKKIKYASSMAQVPSVRASRQYAEELLRQLEIVTVRKPELAQHVISLDVVLTPFSLPRVYNELMRCIALFPNLTTVRLSIINVEVDSEDFRWLYDKHNFPQIKSLFLSPEAVWFSRCCPNASHVAIDTVSNLEGQRSFCQWLTALEKNKKSIQRLGLFPLGGSLGFRYFGRGFFEYVPNLKDITLECNMMRTLLENEEKGERNVIADFRNLQIIHIRADVETFSTWLWRKDQPSIEEEHQQWIQWAERTLHRVEESRGVEREMRIYFTGKDGHCEEHRVYSGLTKALSPLKDGPVEQTEK
ncbi:hypothetical protein CVT24_003770 [Panaeolus cyanescens]|uniref:Uncharacterized protein n=1 Tax=Panaeolus cyanescens TaxID=181874 RepID=A0A409WCA2_9AGAR|nr:hypothetical protein CVT24_003770 [Panaeolus cyanescens]